VCGKVTFVCWNSARGGFWLMDRKIWHKYSGSQKGRSQGAAHSGPSSLTGPGALGLEHWEEEVGRGQSPAWHGLSSPIMFAKSCLKGSVPTQLAT
jgi:hypothetical protein